MLSFFAGFGYEGGRLKRFIDGPVRAMLETLETRSEILRRLKMRPFDDLIGRELGRLSDLLDLSLQLRERDYVGPPGGGWLPAS